MVCFLEVDPPPPPPPHISHPSHFTPTPIPAHRSHRKGSVQPKPLPPLHPFPTVAPITTPFLRTHPPRGTHLTPFQLS